jgi:VRR-NUC domain
MKLKKAGLHPGEPDLRLHWKCERKGNPSRSETLFLEVKIKPNKPTDAQAKCIADLTNIGFPVEVVYSLDEAIAAMKLHGVPTR